MAEYPKALPPVTGELTVITDELVEQALIASRESPRKRIILPFHSDADNTLHRMLNAVQPGSYIRPHRHHNPPKDESLIVIRGALVFYTFDDDGRVDEVETVRGGSSRFGIDVKAGIYHTFIVTEPDTVVYEVKPGPWSPVADKDFAVWAPEEGGSEPDDYMSYLLNAVPKKT